MVGANTMDEPVASHVEDALIQILESRVAGSDVVIFSDYIKGALTARVVSAGIEMATKANVPGVVKVRVGCGCLNPRNSTKGDV